MRNNQFMAKYVGALLSRICTLYTVLYARRSESLRLSQSNAWKRACPSVQLVTLCPVEHAKYAVERNDICNGALWTYINKTLIDTLQEVSKKFCVERAMCSCKLYSRDIIIIVRMDASRVSRLEGG